MMHGFPYCMLELIIVSTECLTKKNYGTMYLRLNQGLHVMRTAVTWLRIGTFIAHDKVRQPQHWSKLSGLHAIPIELMQVAMV